jgi:hypothetical protein
MQSREIAETGHPSLFLNAAPLGVFYPNFAFYGGSLYAVAGYLMVITGTPVAVFVGVIVLSFAAAYGGTFWLARQAGVSNLAAHLPAIIVVTGAYYLSDAYGRGSWPEFVATSAIPLVIASAISIVRCGATYRSITALAAATVVWSGSHNITLAWGGIFLLLVGFSILVACLTDMKQRHVGRIGVVVAVVALGVMINAWFLFPDLSYSLHTQVAQYRELDPAISGIFSRASVVFNPFRERANHTTFLRSHFTELPVLVIAWLVVAVATLRVTTWKPPVRRLLGLLAVLSTGFIVLLLDEAVWHKLPSVLSIIQFTFRLEPYIVMAIAGMTILVLRGIRDRGRRGSSLDFALVAIVVLGLGLGTWQVWNSHAWYYPYSPHYLAVRSSVLRYPHHTPPTWYDTGQLRDVGDQAVPTEGELQLDPAKVKGESTTQTVTVPDGEGPVKSNVAASANLVSVHGLRIAGRTADGFLALERPPGGTQSVRLTINRADTTPLRWGPLITLIGALGLLITLLASAIYARRQRR